MKETWSIREAPTAQFREEWATTVFAGGVWVALAFLFIVVWRFVGRGPPR